MRPRRRPEPSGTTPSSTVRKTPGLTELGDPGLRPVHGTVAPTVRLRTVAFARHEPLGGGGSRDISQSYRDDRGGVGELEIALEVAQTHDLGRPCQGWGSFPGAEVAGRHARSGVLWRMLSGPIPRAGHPRIAEPLYGAKELADEWHDEHPLRSGLRRYLERAGAPRRGRCLKLAARQHVRSGAAAGPWA